MIKTVTVKLHNPSNYKRAILDRVFLRWTLAADVTLRWAHEHLDAFDDCKDQRGNYRGILIANVLNKHVRDRIKRFGLHSSLIDSLFQDIGGTLASYFERQKRDPNTGFPTVYRAKPNATRYEAALDALANLGRGTGEKEIREPFDKLRTTQGRKEERDKGAGEQEKGEGAAVSRDVDPLVQLQGKLVAAARGLDFRVRPIFFSRTDAVPRRRGYSILYDEEQDEYLALLYLLSGSASKHHRKPLAVHKPLLALNPNEEYLVETGHSSGALLFPLEMGSWQKKTFLDPARDDPGIIRTAYLIREVNRQDEVEYYLAVAVDLPSSEPIETVNFLGVHHTLDGEVFALATNPEGKTLHYEQVAGPLELQDAYQQLQAWRRRGKRTPHRVTRERTKHHYHGAANRIITLAEEYRAWVGVEDLSYRRTKTGRKRIDRKLFSAPVSQLIDLLSYKLPFAGLPAPLKVDGISPRECHRCGKESREKTVRAEGRIACPLCGLDMDVHENNARLVAGRVPEILERIKKKREQVEMEKREKAEKKGQ